MTASPFEYVRDPLEAFADRFGQGRELALGRAQLFDGIDDAEDDAPIVTLVQHDVAREQEPYARLGGEGLKGERRIARAEDPVASKVDAELGLERLLEIDLRDDSKPFALQGLRQPRQYLVEPNLELVPGSASPEPELLFHDRESQFGGERVRSGDHALLTPARQSALAE